MGFLAEMVFLQNWEGNHRLHTSLTNVSLPTIKYHQVPLKNGFDAIVKLQLPPNIDTTGKTKYPMLVDVYAGPGSYAGLDKWEIGFSSYLVTSRKYILAQINGRGSGNRGENLLHSIYRAMGTVEIEDQIETAKYYQFEICLVSHYFKIFNLIRLQKTYRPISIY